MIEAICLSYKNSDINLIQVSELIKLPCFQHFIKGKHVVMGYNTFVDICLESNEHKNFDDVPDFSGLSNCLNLVLTTKENLSKKDNTIYIHDANMVRKYFKDVVVLGSYTILQEFKNDIKQFHHFYYDYVRSKFSEKLIPEIYGLYQIPKSQQIKVKLPKGLKYDEYFSIAAGHFMI